MLSKYFTSLVKNALIHFYSFDNYSSTHTNVFVLLVREVFTVMRSCTDVQRTLVMEMDSVWSFLTSNISVFAKRAIPVNSARRLLIIVTQILVKTMACV